MNGLYIAASGAASQVAQLDTVANNLVNSNTPGFRRFVNVLQSIEGNGSPYQYAASGGTPVVEMAQGPLRETSNPLDVAITGPAFLIVQTHTAMPIRETANSRSPATASCSRRANRYWARVAAP